MNWTWSHSRRFARCLGITVCLSSLSALSVSEARALQQDTVRTTPTKAEVDSQSRLADSLQNLRNSLQQQQRQITVLQDSVHTLRQAAADADKGRRRADSVQAIAFRRLADSLAADVKARQDSANRAVTKLRLATVSGWAHSTSSLGVGLSTASAIVDIGQVTLLYRPESAGTFGSITDLIGRLAAIGGAGYAATSESGDNSQVRSGLSIAASGLLMHLAVDGVRRYTKRSSGPLREFAERAAMHKDFASEINALKSAVDSVKSQFTPMIVTADRLVAAGQRDPMAYENFRVTHELAQQYGATIDSYTALVSAFQHAHSVASQLLKESSWTSSIENDLVQIRTSTAAAIIAWRKQTIVSRGLLQNLDRLADIDDVRQPVP